MKALVRPQMALCSLLALKCHRCMACGTSCRTGRRSRETEGRDSGLDTLHLAKLVADAWSFLIGCVGKRDCAGDIPWECFTELVLTVSRLASPSAHLRLFLPQTLITFLIQTWGSASLGCVPFLIVNSGSMRGMPLRVGRRGLPCMKVLSHYSMQ